MFAVYEPHDLQYFVIAAWMDWTKRYVFLYYQVRKDKQFIIIKVLPIISSYKTFDEHT